MKKFMHWIPLMISIPMMVAAFYWSEPADRRAIAKASVDERVLQKVLYALDYEKTPVTRLKLQAFEQGCQLEQRENNTNTENMRIVNHQRKAITQSF